MILDNYIEQWKPIKGYEGMYEVSTYGRVRSLNYNHTKRPKLLSLGLSADKRYYGVCLCKHGKVKRFRVNRLVAETFIPNPCNYPVVNHIDGNSLNNHVQNLEWCTQSHNINHGKRNQIVSQKLRNRKDTSKPVMAILPNGDVEQYPSICEAARKLNGSDGTIWQALNGKVKRVYGGRQWRYING